MKRPLLYLVVVACVVAGAWGYAFEASYFLVLRLNVHDTLSFPHYVASGLLNVVPMLGIAVALSLLMKFFSRNVARDDLKHVQQELSKTEFAQEVGVARLGFVISLVYLLLVLFDVRFYSESSLGYMFWLLTFINMQSFIGAILLSPLHSRAAVVVAFVLSVAMCFSAGGIGLARDAAKSTAILRDDSIVKIERQGTNLVATSKTIKLPFLSRLQSLWPTT